MGHPHGSTVGRRGRHLLRPRPHPRLNQYVKPEIAGAGDYVIKNENGRHYNSPERTKTLFKNPSASKSSPQNEKANHVLPYIERNQSVAPKANHVLP